MYQEAYCGGFYDTKMVFDQEKDSVLNLVHSTTMVMLARSPLLQSVFDLNCNVETIVPAWIVCFSRVILKVRFLDQQ